MKIVNQLNMIQDHGSNLRMLKEVGWEGTQFHKEWVGPAQIDQTYKFSCLSGGVLSRDSQFGFLNRYLDLLAILVILHIYIYI